jgi:SecD/SecF fusion protein
MNRRPHLILVGLLLAALIAIGLMAVPGAPLHKQPTLGLDLQGGLEVTLQAVPPEGRKLLKTDMDRSIEIMRSRVDKLGVAEPEIRKQGDDQIVIALPGIKDPGAAQALIGKTAQLELYDLETSLYGPSIDAQLNPIPHPSLYDLLAKVQSQASKGTPEAYYRFDKAKKWVGGPVKSRDALLAKLDGKLPKGDKIFAVPENTALIRCGTSAVVCPGAVPDQTYFYLFKHDRQACEADGASEEAQKKCVPEMTGEDLKLSGTRADFDTSPGGGGGPIVLMQFTDAGGDKFQRITAAEWVRGKIRQTPQHFAIVLDREIRTFPQIDYTDSSLSGGIGGGSAQITGIESIDEAKNIALVLQTGTLPVKFVTLERTDISATLGEDSLKEAWKAAVAGLIAVALFLLILYRFLGLVAVIGLGIYAAFLYAAILIFNVTLTLPGFAGMILTLGVAADANIVIFERIKEEFRAGKSVRAAIAAGYGKGFHTIVDANVVTAITATVLFLVATAGVKGFALMLLIGTVMSLLTAVAATRAILGLLAGFNWFDNPKFMGAEGEPPKWIRRDFIGKRKLWFAISGAVLLLSVGAIAVKGLNLGIDFRGGTQVTFATTQPVPLEQVRAQAARIGQEGAVIQGRGTPVSGDSYTSFQIRTESLTPQAQTALTRNLERTLNAEAFGVKNVSASFGRQIAKNAILAILVSLLLVVLYIAARFQWTFAGPVIAALLHDVVIAVGVYALLGREVTTATVAAVLTVLGYSIYDTIIIFDRIRENIPLMRRASFRVLANVSLWETIPRSLATTFITLLPLSTLYFFGGETLKDFAFALLVGIGAGAYSSIFIAPQLLSLLKEREPEYRRRKEEGDLSYKDAVSVGGLLVDAEEAAAAAPTPELVPAAAPGEPEAAPGSASAAAKRERRRQRRSTRPHGRAR